ncbi:hypothetical protein CMI37_36150 [Candidatus Pacearchaeota archaeon]|nr:hypothetical protein [Candidatus Pacearchaeota archaeon]
MARRTSREAAYDVRRAPDPAAEARRRASGWQSMSPEGQRPPENVSQGIYEKTILPGQVRAVEEQIGAMERASSTEQAAASARARDISRGLKGTAPTGFEDILRGSITQEAGEALGYESALRGAKAQKEVQDPARMAPIVAQREKELLKIEEEIADQETAGSAIATISTTAGGVMLAGASIAAIEAAGAATAAASPAAGPAAGIVAVIGAVIAITGAIIGAATAGSARESRRGRQKSAKDKYDPSKVKEVSFETALGSAQRGAGGYVGTQFTGGSGVGAGVQSRLGNIGGMAAGQATQAEPWMQFTGVN